MPSHRLESQECRLLYVLSNGGEKIKLEEEAIHEILVADTNSESGAEVSDFDDFEEEEEKEEEEEEEEQQQQASIEVKPQAATSGTLPTWGRPPGRNTNIHPFVCPAKGVKKSETPHINKGSSPTTECCCCFLQRFIICWWNRQTYTTSNT